MNRNYLINLFKVILNTLVEEYSAELNESNIANIIKQSNKYKNHDLQISIRINFL